MRKIWSDIISFWSNLGVNLRGSRVLKLMNLAIFIILPFTVLSQKTLSINQEVLPNKSNYKIKKVYDLEYSNLYFTVDTKTYIIDKVGENSFIINDDVIKVIENSGQENIIMSLVNRISTFKIKIPKTDFIHYQDFYFHIYQIKSIKGKVINSNFKMCQNDVCVYATYWVNKIR